jgi:hypothetical protein
MNGFFRLADGVNGVPRGVILREKKMCAEKSQAAGRSYAHAGRMKSICRRTALLQILAGGLSLPGSTTVTVPTSTVAGAYYLLACADGANMVLEANETNNCQASMTSVVIK